MLVVITSLGFMNTAPISMGYRPSQCLVKPPLDAYPGVDCWALLGISLTVLLLIQTWLFSTPTQLYLCSKVRSLGGGGTKTESPSASLSRWPATSPHSSHGIARPSSQFLPEHLDLGGRWNWVSLGIHRGAGNRTQEKASHAFCFPQDGLDPEKRGVGWWQAGWEKHRRASWITQKQTRMVTYGCLVSNVYRQTDPDFFLLFWSTLFNSVTRWTDHVLTRRTPDLPVECRVAQLASLPSGCQPSYCRLLAGRFSILFLCSSLPRSVPARCFFLSDWLMQSIN